MASEGHNCSKNLRQSKLSFGKLPVAGNLLLLVGVAWVLRYEWDPTFYYVQLLQFLVEKYN